MIDAHRRTSQTDNAPVSSIALVVPIPPNEDARLRALLAHEILDTIQEDAYEEIVELASGICETPIALITLVDQHRVWFKSVIGLDASEMPRNLAFCAHTILEDGLMVIPDAQRDTRFSHNPLVTSLPNIRFYAGTPIQTRDRYKLGTLCVIDRIARQLTPAQARALVTLGRQVEVQLELRLMLSELRAREAELRCERDTLSHMQQQKDELMTLVIHDLKSPIASLLPNARFILEEPSASDEIRHAASDIVDAAEAMSRMVMNLLDISRSEDGFFSLKHCEVDLRALVEQIQKAVIRRALDNNLQIMASVASEVTTILADEDLLRRILANLVDNAIKYSPPGSTICINARRQEDAVDIRVQDEGPGIPRSAREKVFQKYMQLDRDVMVHARAGRGLGLTFCQLAVEAHGGRIWIEDNLPRGSVFCLRLPLQPD